MIATVLQTESANSVAEDIEYIRVCCRKMKLDTYFDAFPAPKGVVLYIFRYEA
ncbi:MAG: hypothetical protein GX804_02595 [Lentisphaerae bacterium]|jgi:hypothetical protein|nr:hypothetical protein [Lentisphaerota bacterium]